MSIRRGETKAKSWGIIVQSRVRNLQTSSVCAYQLIHGNRNFASWNPSPGVVEGSAEYYSTQMYSHGTRCWNGPERSVKVPSFSYLDFYSPNNRSQLDLTCGTENVLLTITELEKCEYLFTGTTPALCLPLEDDTVSRKDEL